MWLFASEALPQINIQCPFEPHPSKRKRAYPKSKCWKKLISAVSIRMVAWGNALALRAPWTDHRIFIIGRDPFVFGLGAIVTGVLDHTVADARGGVRYQVIVAPPSVKDILGSRSARLSSVMIALVKRGA